MAVKDLMGSISAVVEIAGVACILGGFLLALVRSIIRLTAHDAGTAYRAFRATFGHSVLLGLEILVAADLIRTVAVAPSLSNLSVLAALVAIRTFLAWSLEVEIEGRWPWRRAAEEAGTG
jgi:uncharacterized membrane protein